MGISETCISSRPRTATVLSGRIAAKTETQHTFVNGTQSVVIFWIYYPFETRVYCAKQIFSSPYSGWLLPYDL
ncbi:hypothetical protein R1087_004108 [Salmonella enterica]|uniref:Uncharacterized protein n=3 Tax=Salmonella enterica TaxID=28901 RepID=A0A3T7S3I7_SALET|nr:hypothetical protein [Salmonella enterica subsp. enterica serovar Java]EAA2594906.1 hypothetical protein [Salmonella enterica subsp. enterica serovar Poona]EAO1478962.1 hypothetical protein [Salmonella enterica]EBH3381930.1 hypothetical protein [Salmonella enterica subsp. enterica serovar Infantis]EBQ9440012.1 hypothetical protein [Salmonella enterica subsp. enterica serovar Cerro]EBU6735300.1 hypothetical protein [Salmonella enterica subsp. enterica serovar Adelaide]EBU8672817.1 hypotheti